MNKTILTFIILVAFIALPKESQAQITYEGINVTDFSEPGSDWTYRDKDGLYLKELKSSYFQAAFINPEKKISFILTEPTAMIFSRVNRTLRQKFGDPDINDDYIPDRAKGDIEYLSVLVDQNKAEVVRVWELKKEMIAAMLLWRKGSLLVSFEKVDEFK